MSHRQKDLISFFGEKRKSQHDGKMHPVPVAKRPRQGPLQRADRSRFGCCPMCRKHFPMHILVSHAQACDGTIKPTETEWPATQRIAAVASVDDEPAAVKEDSSEGGEEVVNALSGPSVSTRAQSDNLTPWWKRVRFDKPRAQIRTLPDPIQPTCEPLPGLFLFEDLVTPEEEADIVAQLDGRSGPYRQQFLPWKLANFNGPHLGKRWGVHCNLRDRRVSEPEHPLPHFFHDILLPKLRRLEPMMGCVPNEANAIGYYRKRGHHLESHVDDRQLSKEPIANLSVAGDCYMTFRNEKDKNNVKVRKVLLKRRTLQVLTGKARYDYSHGIQNEDLLSDRRVSITMRESPPTARAKA